MKNSWWKLLISCVNIYDKTTVWKLIGCSYIRKFNFLKLLSLHSSLPSLYIFFFFLDEAREMMFRCRTFSFACFPFDIVTFTGLKRQLEKGLLGKDRELKKWQADIFIIFEGKKRFKWKSEYISVFAKILFDAKQYILKWLEACFSVGKLSDEELSEALSVDYIVWFFLHFGSWREFKFIWLF